eukprot:scaffold274_cov462-Pavlova_lutheri.AAC.2
MSARQPGHSLEIQLLETRASHESDDQTSRQGLDWVRGGDRPKAGTAGWELAQAGSNLRPTEHLLDVAPSNRMGVCSLKSKRADAKSWAGLNPDRNTVDPGERHAASLIHGTHNKRVQSTKMESGTKCTLRDI